MNFTPEVNPQEDAPATVKPWEWKGLLRRARLDFATKAIGRAIADYADKKTGEDIFPGTAHLIVDTGASDSTVRRALKRLLALGLIRMTKPANKRRGLSAEYALAIPEDPEERGLVVLSPDEYKAAVQQTAAELAASLPVTVTGKGELYRSHSPVNDVFTGHSDRSPTSNTYLPDKSDPPDELALTPELTTAREEKIMTPEESDAKLAELKAQGVTGRELARQMQAAAGKPWAVPPERVKTVGLPPVPPDNGLARLRAAVEGKVEVEATCQEE